VLSHRDTAVDAARSMMRFFKHKSGGQCAQCRDRTAKASALIDKRIWDLNLLGNFSKVMRHASICALGQAAPNPIECVMKYFPHEVPTRANPEPYKAAGNETRDR
jgi:NADH:ubiquinone oxidoreductase subunit F (NADH-binding)